MVKNYFLLFSLVLLQLAVFGNNPKSSVKKAAANVKRQTIQVVKQPGSNLFLLQSESPEIKLISFVVTDAKGVVQMFGDNYNNGSLLSFNHLSNGDYTMYFASGINSSEARFTVNR